MNYNVVPIKYFKKEFKKLVAKYPSLKNELFELNEILKNNPTIGTPLGNNTFKIRISIKSKKKGKSGGARIITYSVFNDKIIYLLSIYDKSSQENIDNKILKILIEEINNNLHFK